MSNITYRLVKGQELTFAEIDENFSSLDSDIRGNRRYFDSTLEQFGLGRDSDFLAGLAERDSDAAAIILLAIDKHDSDITDLNDRCDSEHAWNLIEHKELADSIGREHAFNVAEHDILQYNINQISGNLDSGSDSEHAWNVSEHSIINGRVDAEEQARILNDVLLGNALDSEHNWNLAEHNSINNQIGAKLDSEHSWNVSEHAQLQTNLDSAIAEVNITVASGGLSSGTGININASNQIDNTQPDRIVSIAGSGATTVSGTYPNFNVSSTDNNTTYTAGTGLSLSGTQFTNTAPDRTVSITGGGSTTVTGTYPNFSVTSVGTTYTGGNGISVSGSSIAMSGSFTGTFTATGDVVAYSDMALKSEVTAIDEALDKLMAITGYTYNTKESTRRHSGVMAQEVEKVLPEVVHTSEDGTKGVAYGNMMGLVIEAIRELKTQVDELKGK